MIDGHLLERGTFPDIAVDAQGVEWIAVQENAARKAVDPPALVVWRDRADVLRLQLPRGEAYPKIGQGRVWYRFGDTSLDCLDLATLTPGPFAPLSLIHGTDPVAVSRHGIAWQEALNGDVVVWRQATPEGQRAVVRHGAPTGLSRVLADRVTLVDEERTIRLPSGLRTRPCWPAPGIVVVEQPERGLEVWIDGVGVCVLWPTVEVFTPRAALAPDGAVHVVAWGPSAGVLVARVTAADCRPYVAPTPTTPAPRPTLPPTPKEPPVKSYFDEGAIVRALREDYAAAGRSDDPEAGVWIGRIAYSHYEAGLPLELAIKKHRNELRGALGLPPL